MAATSGGPVKISKEHFASDPCRLEETEVSELDSSIMREVSVIRTHRLLHTVQGDFTPEKATPSLYILHR